MAAPVGDRLPKTWTALVPATLPTKRLWLHGFDRDPRLALAGHSWAPLESVDATNSDRTDMSFERASYFCDASSAQRLRTGANHYGPCFLITVRASDVELSLLGDDEGFEGELRASMRMLELLVREAQLALRWCAYSVYEDTRASRATGSRATRRSSAASSATAEHRDAGCSVQAPRRRRPMRLLRPADAARSPQ